MSVFFMLAGYAFRPKPWRELLSQSRHLCDPCGRLVYSLADDASAYGAASAMALCVDCALRVRHRVGVRDQEGVIKSGRRSF